MQSIEDFIRLRTQPDYMTATASYQPSTHLNSRVRVLNTNTTSRWRWQSWGSRLSHLTLLSMFALVRNTNRYEFLCTYASRFNPATSHGRIRPTLYVLHSNNMPCIHQKPSGNVWYRYIVQLFIFLPHIYCCHFYYCNYFSNKMITQS